MTNKKTEPNNGQDKDLIDVIDDLLDKTIEANKEHKKILEETLTTLNSVNDIDKRLDQEIEEMEKEDLKKKISN